MKYETSNNKNYAYRTHLDTPQLTTTTSIMKVLLSMKGYIIVIHCCSPIPPHKENYFVHIKITITFLKYNIYNNAH